MEGIIISVDTIEETIKLAGWGRKKAMRKQINLFESELLDDEELVAVGASQPNPTTQIYVTNQKVIVHEIAGLTKNNMQEIPLENISSIAVNGGLLGATVEINASNTHVEAEKIPLHVAKELRKQIHTLMNAAKAN